MMERMFSRECLAERLAQSKDSKVKRSYENGASQVRGGRDTSEEANSAICGRHSKELNVKSLHMVLCIK